MPRGRLLTKAAAAQAHEEGDAASKTDECAGFGRASQRDGGFLDFFRGGGRRGRACGNWRGDEAKSDEKQ